MIYSPSHGDTAFTVPLFDQYKIERDDVEIGLVPGYHPDDER
jgi:hypothetical protein